MSTNAFPYVKLRLHADGGYRPRFEPGPKQRALGFAATDLKHPDGRWFNLEEASIYAKTKLAEIKAAAAGAPARPTDLPRKARKSVGDLIDAFLSSLEFLERKPLTQEAYRFHGEALRWRRQSRQDRAARLRPVAHPFSLVAASIVTKRDVKALHAELTRERSKAVARNVIMFLSACYKWAATAPGWAELEDRNPCTQLRLARPLPRVKTWSVEAVRAMIAEADAAGLPSIGDAVMLALYSAQRQSDVLALVDQVGRTSIAQRAAEGRTLRFKQQKTGARVAVFAAPDLVVRLTAAEKRRAALKVVPLKGTLPVVLDERHGTAWVKTTFVPVFRRLRRKAAKRCPELLELTFQDLRDTAITWLGKAGCTVPEICSYSGHKLATAAAILAHYLELGEDMAAAAAAKQAAWLERNNIRLGGGAAE